MYGRCLGRPQAPVAEGGPVGFSDGGGTDGTGSPGPGGCGRPKRRPNGDVILIIALILDQVYTFDTSMRTLRQE